MSVRQLPGTTDAAADDACLARLDFTNDALTLNLGALIRFGNPFLPDVAASTLLAVAVAEATRGRPSRKGSRQGSLDEFKPPPPSFTLTHEKESTARCFKDSFLDGFGRVGGKAKSPASISKLKQFASLKSSPASCSPEASFDKDIELGEWYGQDKTKEAKAEKKARKTAEDDSKLPFVVRALIAGAKFAFKAVFFVVQILFKIIAGLVVMLTRNASKL